MKHHVEDQPVPPPLPTKARKGASASISVPSSRSPGNLPFVKYYLFAYNSLSALAWSYVLILALIHLFDLDSQASSAVAGTQTATATLARIVSSLRFSYPVPSTIKTQIPRFLQPLYHRATTTYARVGVQTAFVQTAALLEVLHVLLGWVRSTIPTTAMQVSSRLFLVWGIAEQFEVSRVNPLYASMIIAWSMTEVIRYSFYACMLAGYELRFLFYLRYTTFYVLYPMGAGSEAFLIYATLPPSTVGSGWEAWFQQAWKPTDYIRALLFLIWWPGLYVLYTHMIRLRRKVLRAGPGRVLGSKPKSM